MTRDAELRLLDIAEALEFIRAHVGGSFGRPEIPTPIVLHAVLFNLMVIGEATKNVDEELQTLEPGVPWRNYAGLRDIIAHEYFRIQREIIEDTVRKDLPALAEAVARLRERPT